MKKFLSILVVVLLLSMFMFSLSYAQWSNYAAPQLEFISNAFPLLWNKPKTEIQRIMSIFPAFPCTDYGDQLACKSKYSYKGGNNNIFINFFTDDYEEHHDNLWKVSVTADIQSAQEIQDFFNILWIDGMKPFHEGNEEEYSYKGVVPLMFDNESTSMVAYFQPFTNQENPFFLVEYYNGYMR